MVQVGSDLACCEIGTTQRQYYGGTDKLQCLTCVTKCLLLVEPRCLWTSGTLSPMSAVNWLQLAILVCNITAAPRRVTHGNEALVLMQVTVHAFMVLVCAAAMLGTVVRPVTCAQPPTL